MKLKYLGTGASEGIPSLYCRCPVCENARKEGGKGQCQTYRGFLASVYTSPSTDRTAISAKGKTKGLDNSENVFSFL